MSGIPVRRNRSKVSITVESSPMASPVAAAAPSDEAFSPAANAATSPAGAGPTPRTGNTTLPSTNAGNSTTSSQDNVSNSPIADDDTFVAYQSTGGGCGTDQQTAQAQKMLKSALGTFKEYAEGLATDLMAVDGSSDSGNQRSARSSKTSTPNRRKKGQQAREKPILPPDTMAGFDKVLCSSTEGGNLKPMATMRQKLAGSKKAAMGGKSPGRRKGGSKSGTPQRPSGGNDGDLVGEDDTHATMDTTVTGTTKKQASPLDLPVQFLQQMMSANCMINTAGYAVDCGNDNDGSSYTTNSSEDESADSSQNPRSLNGKANPKYRSPARTRGRSRGRGGELYTNSSRDSDRRMRHRGSRRGGGRRDWRDGSSSALSGRPEDIPEGDEEEDSALSPGQQRAAATQEDLSVIGRLPNGVVRDKGSPKQQKMAPDVDQLRQFANVSSTLTDCLNFFLFLFPFSLDPYLLSCTLFEYHPYFLANHQQRVPSHMAQSARVQAGNGTHRYHHLHPPGRRIF